MIYPFDIPETVTIIEDNTRTLYNVDIVYRIYKNKSKKYNELGQIVVSKRMMNYTVKFHFWTYKLAKYYIYEDISILRGKKIVQILNKLYK